ncbi:MAG: hypothetical protein NTZ33_11100 [Bacteroidetes bacterium]|nr:hypothetical protein [Bacteroidota bacterium]
MKTKLLIVLAIFFFGCFSLRAGNDELSFKQTVVSKIVYPEFAKNQKLDADVFISLTVNEEGEIIINQSNSLNADLMEYVKTELKKIKVEKDNPVIGKTYIYKFVFKYEE